MIICACSVIFGGCAGQDTKDDSGGGDLTGRRHEKTGAEDFMPERVRVVYVRSCASCHGPNGRGITAVAPDIYRAKHRSVGEWEKYLRDSKDAHPVGNPPPLWLEADEMKDMAEYLESVTQRNQ